MSTASLPGPPPEPGTERSGGLERLAPVNIAAGSPGLVELAEEAPAAATVLSFDDFYGSTREPVGRALALTLGDVELATDAVDEALARAYQRWDDVQGYANPAGWVYRVALNWARSILRRRRRSLHRLYEPDAYDGPALADPDVHRALAELDWKHRSVVVCRHLLGWSELETASALGLRPGTVKSRLHRATAHLQVRLGHLRPEEHR